MSETTEEWKARMGIGKRASFPRIVGGDGTTRTKAVLCDDGPGVAGTRTEHWNGREDAKATAMTVHVNPAIRAHLEP